MYLYIRFLSLCLKVFDDFFFEFLYNLKFFISYFLLFYRLFRWNSIIIFYFLYFFPYERKLLNIYLIISRWSCWIIFTCVFLPDITYVNFKIYKLSVRRVFVCVRESEYMFFFLNIVFVLKSVCIYIYINKLKIN